MSHDLTALYEKLSHDDELQGESNSISNQKAMLEDYAQKNGFTGIRHFTDDGISGTTFEREGLQAMLAEVEKGNIGTIIVKDMSRMGRNYVQMGMLREQLRRANVRLIAVNEGVDTGSGFDDDFLPFRDVSNEYYAKDISKKIKSTFKAKGESGKHVASSPPYGYLKDSGDKNQWVIDEAAAPIVRRIFRMTLEGYGPCQISTMAEKEPTLEELEEMRKKEARKDKLHQNYLKRKANGKQKEYEERTKAKKKAQIESQKEQIRAEDREKGIYFHAGVPSIPRANSTALSRK